MKAPSIAYKQGFWKEHSKSWKASGLTQQAYCEQEGISYNSFVYQHNRSASKSKKASLKFIEAKPESVAVINQTAGLQLMLPNGIRIGINAELNPALLQTVLSVAGAFQC